MPKPKDKKDKGKAREDRDVKDKLVAVVLGVPLHPSRTPTPFAPLRHLPQFAV
eukprot:gene9072-8190_t